LSTELRENLDAILWQSVFPAGAEAGGRRRVLRELYSAQPPTLDGTVYAATRNGVD
jgi:hypothetical protein